MGANTAEIASPGTLQKLTDHLAASCADLFVRPTRSHSSPPGGDRRDRRPLGHHSSAKASHRPDPLGTGTSPVISTTAVFGATPTASPAGAAAEAAPRADVNLPPASPAFRARPVAALGLRGRRTPRGEASGRQQAHHVPAVQLPAVPTGEHMQIRGTGRRPRGPVLPVLAPTNHCPTAPPNPTPAGT